MNTKLLQKLADYLRTVPPTDFDMNVWGDGNVADDGTPMCGTAACLVGHATVISDELILEEAVDGNGLYPFNTRTRREYEAAFADAFDLDISDAYDLSDSDADHQTPEEAADAIEDLLDRGSCD